MGRLPLVLVTGATGAIGPLVVNAFHAAGHSIRTLSIDPPSIKAWPDDVETRFGDITNSPIVRAAMRDVDTVIHLAALLHIVNPQRVLLEKYERINVGGTATVVAAAVHASVRRIVFFSTIAVYGKSSGLILTEDAPVQPDSFYASTKLEAEKIVLAAKGSDGENIGSILRLAAVYGSRIKGNYRNLVQSLATGRFIPIGKGSNRRTLVYDKDVAHAAVLAAGNDAAAGKIYNVSDGDFHSVSEIIGAICDALGRKFPGFEIPVLPVRWGAGLMEATMGLLGRQSPVTRENIDKYTEDIAVDSHRIRDELGFRPQYDLATGWQETIQEMRRIGEL